MIAHLREARAWPMRFPAGSIDPAVTVSIGPADVLIELD
jgi:hypothetical protein